MIRVIGKLTRYITCGRVTKRPIFEFISPGIHPNDACMVFPFEDDYSFGTTVRNALGLVRGEVFHAQVGLSLHLRHRLRHLPMAADANLGSGRAHSRSCTESSYCQEEVDGWVSLSLRELYQLTELPGDNPIKAAQNELDSAVRLAYGIIPGAISFHFFSLSISSWRPWRAKVLRSRDLEFQPRKGG